ncbi:NUMOD4 motif/HNH endonuclease [[Clostridium] sordellii]|uniref:HNH endonuclease signature motif containing protein n=1 Tax=Paraclostridium sordellii TaxID=1505 RepID=UPI0005DECA17|nr:HNH endonuclease signature motif containing protein [Paeniclostridium sordellii]CEQ01670.1 NUMOD4 motif/HNH endonuclease [[Clostridium] sordellii] [Paeniclostridium sordellii]
MEEWREINGYKVSNYGKVINKKGEYLSTKPSKSGYVTTMINGGNLGIIRGLHRIVATVFIPNPENKPEVNHIDGDKTNNRVDNLEWVTKKENQQHEAKRLKKRSGESCYMSKLDEDIVMEIYNKCKEGKMRYKDIAEEYNVNPSFVSQLVTNRVWRHLNLPPLKPKSRWSIK